MVVPSGLVVYLVVLALGVVAGLLLRFFVALIALLAVGVGLLWLLGYLPAAVIERAGSALRQGFAGLALGPEVLFSLVGAVFVAGLLIGVLLTTPLPGSSRPA